MATHLRIRSLTVSTNSASHKFDFAAPLSFVTGTTTMGKSTLLMLIKHAFGGNAALTPGGACPTGGFPHGCVPNIAALLPRGSSMTIWHNSDDGIMGLRIWGRG